MELHLVGFWLHLWYPHPKRNTWQVPQSIIKIYAVPHLVSIILLIAMYWSCRELMTCLFSQMSMKKCKSSGPPVMCYPNQICHMVNYISNWILQQLRSEFNCYLLFVLDICVCIKLHPYVNMILLIVCHFHLTGSICVHIV